MSNAITNGETVVVYCEESESLWQISIADNAEAQKLLADYQPEEVLCELGFTEYSESGGYKIAKPNFFKKLAIPQAAFSTHWEGSRFFLKTGDGVDAELFVKNPMPKSYQISQKRIDEVLAQCDRIDAVMARLIYQGTAWGQFDDEVVEVWEDPVTRDKYSSNNPVNREKALHFAKVASWQSTLKGDGHQWFLDWAEYL